MIRVTTHSTVHSTQYTVYTTRAKEVYDLYLQHPDWTLGRIGQEVGVGKEWVRQMLGKQGIHKGKIIAEKNRLKSICPICHGGKSTYSETCRNCYTEIIKSKLTTLICEECGKEFTIPTAVVASKSRHGYNIRWCSRVCHGRYMGRGNRIVHSTQCTEDSVGATEVGANYATI